MIARSIHLTIMVGDTPIFVSYFCIEINVVV